jgi:6-phosphogluconolactonase
MRLYVGTYTRPGPFLAAANGRGLYVLDFDEATGGLTMRQEVTGIENPSFLCISPDGRALHAVSEVPDSPEGLVGSYAIEPSTGELSRLGVQGSRGTLTCYAAMDSRSQAAFVANYWSGTVAMFPARPDGSLAEASSVRQHEGRGRDAARQEGPHAHSIVVSPDDRFAFAADLGADAVVAYRIDYERMELRPRARLAMPPGSGPRHLAFGPDGASAYVICELDSTVAALDYDRERGELTLLGARAMLPAGFKGESLAADIAVHPSGRFVYGSNRGHDSIAMFAIPPGGRPAPLGHRSTQGRTPRSVTISPDGRFLLAANQDSDTIVVIAIDPDSGMLGETASIADIPTPVCVRFAPVRGAARGGQPNRRRISAMYPGK